MITEQGENILYLVTGNPGKLKEIRRWLEPLGIPIETYEKEFIEVQADGLEDVVYYGMKELVSTHDPGVPLIKDDSGLFIESLSGFPGVYSSYVQRTISNRGILRLMENMEERGAVFKTVIGLYQPRTGTISLFRGECRGEISLDEKGRQGFGFDPIFIPEGGSSTFAEMSLNEKNSVSHRTMAVSRLAGHLKEHML
ncbi:MAG: XTP/dITP diphosphatase [Thermoplasmatota archaeon]